MSLDLGKQFKSLLEPEMMEEGFVDQILNMTNHQKLVRNIMFVGFLVNIVGNLFLIPRFGYLGAAISSLVVNVIVNSIFVLVIKKKLGFYTFI